MTLSNNEAHAPVILFDHRIFALQVYGGISFYLARLVAALPDRGLRPRILAPIHINPAIQELPPSIVCGARVRGGRVSLALARRAGRLAGEFAMPLARGDVHHETYYGERRLAARNIPVVITVHDMIHELYPEQFPGDRTHLAKRESIRRADAIICISESTRRDLLHFYPEVADRTTVILHGVDQPGASVPVKMERHGKPYILYVGQRRGYKNFAGLVSAFSSSPLLRADFDLICVGPAFTPDEQAMLSAAGISDAVRAVTASEAELAGLYAGAAVFVYPSLYEGFGMPPLEAMSAGCPVVCVRASSVPEICGDAAAYAEPGDLDGLRDAIEAVAVSPDRQAMLRSAGYERVRDFTWGKCADATAAVYRSLI